MLDSLSEIYHVFKRGREVPADRRHPERDSLEQFGNRRLSGHLSPIYPVKPRGRQTLFSQAAKIRTFPMKRSLLSTSLSRLGN